MAKKRFQLIDDGEYIKDIQDGTIYDACGGGDGVPMLVDLVNKLINENKKLKDRIKELDE